MEFNGIYYLYIRGVSYLILADGMFLQQVLVTATDLEDVFTLIFLNAHLQLLW